MITKKRIPIGLLLMGLWIGHGFAQSKAVDPSSQIIWQDGPGSWALFIPEPLLQSENLLGLDIPNQQWQLITESWLTAKDARFKSDNDMPHCFASSESQTAILPDSEAQPLANVLRTQESVLVGAVESIWNGWGPDGPRTLIYLRVQECLKSKEPGLYFPDDLVCLSVQAGRVFIDGEVLCNETDGLVDFPVIGDSVLVSGYYFEPDPQYLGNGMVFTLKDERIMPQPYRMVSDRQPVNYSNLRVDLARDSVPQIVEALKTEGPCTVIRGGDHHLVGTVSISIPVQGLSSDLKQGIRGGMAHWNDGCNLSNIPNFAVDTATPPPTGPYDPTQVIRIQLINAEPEWNPATNNWVAATYQFGNGASTILLPQKCPKPRNGKVFPFCDQNNVFIRWSEKQGKANIAHELGHALGLGHDDCSEDSIMQPSPTRNAAISPDHCNLADSLNCPPTNSNCPTGELVPFSLNVTGWDRPDIIYVSVTVTSPNGQAPPFEITAENNGLFSGPPIRVGDSYQITNIYTTNNKKDCVASPHSGTAEANQPIAVGISCTCRPPEENCDVQLSNPRLNEFPPPILDLFWGPWWGWIWGPGFGSLPCNRQTYCEDGPTHVITIDTIEIVTSELICTDLCQGKRVPIYNDLGPSVSVEFPNGNASIENEIVISGWAVDRHGVSGLAFFVDQQKVQLQNLEMGISRPESCVQAMVPNQLNCDGNTGFFGILETSKLGEGPHLLQIVAADSFPGYPMATLVEKEIIIQPGCVDHSPPSVSLVGISNGANLVIDSTTILLEADAFDEPGGSGLKEVRFFIDGVRQSTDQTAPYRYSWPATIGNHEIKLVALDHCFNSNQAIVNVTVSANPPSSVPGFAGRINGQNLNGMTVYSTQPSIHFSWAAATDPTGIGLYQLVLQPT
ncbi:MAG: hypothetical protein KDC71_16465, partial [Acidobacteria bacterium]|nr:hypothetical protein [Acidobacteriota bacterium]